MERDTERDTYSLESGYGEETMTSGKTLTDTAVKNAKPKLVEGELREIRLYDRDGLYLTVASTGKKWWRLKFHFAGKERRMGLTTAGQRCMVSAR